MNFFLGPDGGLAVASGTREQVEHWSELLRNAKVRFETRYGSQIELWVEGQKADRARTLIRGEVGANVELLWRFA